MTFHKRRLELSCLHTHTTFCDGKADVETMCQAALAKGFTSLGFSSHAPIEKKIGIKTNWHLKEHRLAEYIDTVEAAKKRWKGKLTVYLGLEVDYLKGYCGPADPDIQALPLDYIIGSVHYLFSPKNGGIFNADEYPENFKRNVLSHFDNNGKALCEAYYDSYNSMISTGGCDILGHIDLIKKNNGPHNFFSAEESWYKECLVKTADLIAGVRASAEKNSMTANDHVPVVEVNTGTLIRNYCPEPYPSPDFLKLLHERNIPLVLNADAHSPDHLGGEYETACQFMQEAGYSAMVLFEGRQNGKAVWRESPR